MSSLSSLLVRDGVVSVKRMERAFQAQVIEGGALDTILLEQELIGEEQLVEYLAAATGLPAATWDECEVVDDEAVRRVPLDVALEHDVAPLSFADGALTVLVRDPFEPARIAALADRLGVTVVPLIVPEYRWHLVFIREYDQPPDDRFLTLATTIGAPAATEVRQRPAPEPDEAAVVYAPAPAEAAPPAIEVAPPVAEAAPPPAEVAPPVEAAPPAAEHDEYAEHDEAALVHAPPPVFDHHDEAPAHAADAAAADEEAAPPTEPVAEPVAAELEPARPSQFAAVRVSTAELEAAEAPPPETPTAELPAPDVPTAELPAPEVPTAELPAVEALAEAPAAEAPAALQPPSERTTADLPSNQPPVEELVRPSLTAGWDIAAPVDEPPPSVSAGWIEPVETAPSVSAGWTTAEQLAPTATGSAVAAVDGATQPLPTWRGDAAPAEPRERRATRPGLAVAPEPSPAAITPSSSPSLSPPAATAPPASSPSLAPSPSPPATRSRSTTPPPAATATGETLASRVALLDEDERPLDRPTAQHLIEVAEDRDRVFHALLRALRSRTRWAGVLIVQPTAAVGRVAFADLGIDTAAFANVSIPLDRPSPFHAVIVGRHPYVGQVTSGDPAIDEMVVRMGGTVPASALLLPVVLRDRCVALAVSHSGAVPITLADVSDMLPLAAAAAQALGRILLSRKREQAPAAPPVDPLTPRSPRAPTLIPAVTRGGVVGGGVVTAARSPADAITATAPVIVAPALRPLASVLADLDSENQDVVDAAIAEGAARADELLPLLSSRFPGPLRVDRYAAGGRTLPPRQYGPLLALVERIGARAGDALIELLGDPDRDVRFYAAVCLGAIRPRSALPALVERIFDNDYGVRNAALEVLASFSPRDIDQVMASVRPALHSDDLERVAAVTHAAATLTDVGALGDLVEVVGKDSKRAELARRALVALTRHDMGTSARRWRSWYDEHRGRHRIEWLIDALGHRDQPLREAALEDLRRLTGEDFGGVGDENRRDREAVTERWRAWWGKTGRRRFVA